MHADAARVSAIILSYNSNRYLERCLRSLIAALGEGGARDEIWVIENGSTDGSAERLRALEAELGDLLRVLYLDRNTGTTFSRNLALRKATGRYLLIMDSDVEVPAGTLPPLLDHLDRHPECGIISPRLIYPSGRLQLSWDVFPTVPRKLRRYLDLRRMEDAARAPAEATPVDYTISAFWLLRRDVFERVGELDERFFYAPEDVDYCLRVWEAGYTVVYEPSVHAVHDAQELSRGFPMRSIALEHAKGLAHLFRKHRYALGHSRLYRRINRFRHAE